MDGFKVAMNKVERLLQVAKEVASQVQQCKDQVGEVTLMEEWQWLELLSDFVEREAIMISFDELKGLAEFMAANNQSDEY